MSTRPVLRTVTAAALLALTVAGCSNTDTDNTNAAADLHANTVTALDFPRTVFDGWEITDPADRPSSAIPAIGAAAGSSEDLVYSPTDCGPDGAHGAALWAIVDGGGGQWAGQVGENTAAGQTFTTTVTASTADSLNAVTDFAQNCARYTATAGGRTLEVTTTATNAEPLRYGLSDARLFTSTVTVSGAPERVYSTLTGVGQVDGRIVTGQFTAPGRIEGPTINVAGNWWNVLATKAVGAKS